MQNTNFQYNYGINFVNNNFDIKSYKLKDINVARHIIVDNTLSNEGAKPEKDMKFKNIIIPAMFDNFDDVKKHLQEQSNKIETLRNDFIFKSIVQTLNLKPQEQCNQAIIKKWANHEVEKWKKRGVKVLVAVVHLNETSVNLHILAENTKVVDGKLTYGWSLTCGKLDDDIKRDKEKYLADVKKENEYRAKHGKKLIRVRTDVFGSFEIRQLHRDDDRDMAKFCKENNLKYKQEPIRISGKSLSIQDYKKLIAKFGSLESAEAKTILKDVLDNYEQNEALIETLKAENENFKKQINEKNEIIKELMEYVKKKGKGK